MMDHCPVCGDVKACLHRPDDVIRRALEQEYKNADARRSK